MRSRYALGVGATIGLGLASRRWPILGKYPGDALWALMVYFGLGVIFPGGRGISRAFGALGIAFAVEFQKLNQNEWLVAVRQSTWGHLVFGQVFSWQNLVAYTVGLAAWLMLIPLLPLRWRIRSRVVGELPT